MKEEIREYLSKIFDYSLGGIILICLGLYVYKTSEFSRLYNEITKKADFDRNGLVSELEWKKVYEELEKADHNKHGIDLSVSEMERYLKH